MSGYTSFLRELLDNVSPENVPPEFVIMAHIRTLDDEELCITGKTLADIMADPLGHGVAEIKFLLDLEKIDEALNAAVDSCFRAAF